MTKLEELKVIYADGMLKLEALTNHVNKIKQMIIEEIQIQNQPVKKEESLDSNINTN